MDKRKTQYFDNQNWLHLASIQSASVGFLGIIAGQQLAIQYGPGTAICSIGLGNLILWLIGIAVISMVGRARDNAIESMKDYVGKYGGALAALILFFAFLLWYAFEINATMTEFRNLFQFTENWRGDLFVRVGAALGLITALLAIGGIRLLRRLTVVCLPLLFCYHLYLVMISDCSVSLKGSWGLSFPAVLHAVINELPGVINFPTFFRHSRSKAHSFLALTVLTILITFFEISTIWIRFSSSNADSIFYLGLMAAFTILILIFCNLLNIYLASACWKTFVPQYGGGKEFAIIGLMGTLTYTFIQISTPVQFLMDLTNAYLASLGVVLLMAYLIRIIIRHRPRPLEKWISLATWIFGCLVATLYEVKHFLQGTDALLAGVNASLLFFLCVIFLEETLWAVKKKTRSFLTSK